MMTGKIDYGVPNKIKELWLGYVEHDYMHIRGHKKDHGTSKKLKVVAES